MNEVAQTTNAAARLRAGILRVAGALKGYARSRRASAMIVSGAFVLVGMAVSGAGLSNYAWREAQWQELQAVTRAAVSAAGTMLATAGTPSGNQQISARVAEFMSGLMPGLIVKAADIAIARGADDVVSVEVEGSYAFQDLLGSLGGGSSAETVTTAVRVKLEVNRYEVAVAADLSSSMNSALPDGTTKLQALKNAFVAAGTALQAQTANNPGSMMVSLVPYVAAVNVADTCAESAGVCTDARTEAKERYVRMLAGGRATIAETLTDARDAVANDKRVHWVDTFRNYGMSRNSPLTHRYLPEGLLDDTDWHLRRMGVNIDVSSDVPNLGNWTVDGEDFWNGCLMARWGARWDADARPSTWDHDDPNTWTWPATKAVAAWSPRGTALPATTPLHLSDAPPLASDLNSLFTAYSWPDARIGTEADAVLKQTHLEMMFPGTSTVGLYAPFQPNATYPVMMGYNHWERPAHGGGLLCPRSSISPLTDDLVALQAATNAFDTSGTQYWAGNMSQGQTMAARGVIWALRTLSPLWQNVWHVQDAAGRARPGVPCAPGDTGNCDAQLKKSIFLIADGVDEIGRVRSQRLNEGKLPPHPSNPGYGPWVCSTRSTFPYAKYYDTRLARDETSFNNYFKASVVAGGQDLVQQNGKLGLQGMIRFSEALLVAQGTDCATEPARCQAIQNALYADPPTPWEIFHSLDSDAVDKLMDGNFGLTGRPTLVGHICRPTSLFTVYGTVGDVVEAGDAGAVAGKAPFEYQSMASVANNVIVDHVQRPIVRAEMESRVEDWLVEACRIAGLRRVRVHALYIGHEGSPGIENLEACVDAAGGDPNEDEVYVVPTAEDIRDTIVNLFTLRRNLRFID